MDLSVNPKFQAFDSNGAPLSGGKVYTYVGGTVTPKITYSDRDLTTPNANPVILDSRGEASIFCSGLLKIILKDSDDVLIWTMDNLKPSDASVFADVDGDTKFQVEEGSDDDTPRVDAGGVEVLALPKTGASGALFKDEDDMASDDPGCFASQQSIKAYVDAVIPTGEKILFYKDTAVVGYTLEDTLDDKVVYVTKGSAAGGQTGGTVHSASTWTISGINITVSTHILTINEMPAHDHDVYMTPILSGTATTSILGSADTASASWVDRVNNTGGGGAHGHPGSTASGDGAWRPAAFCHTMQTRI